MPNIQFQFRRGPAADWATANPVLASGELGLETDTNQFKIGTGLTGWNFLPYGGMQGATGPRGLDGFSSGMALFLDSAGGTATNVAPVNGEFLMEPRIDLPTSRIYYNHTQNSAETVEVAKFVTPVGGLPEGPVTIVAGGWDTTLVAVAQVTPPAASAASYYTSLSYVDADGTSNETLIATGSIGNATSIGSSQGNYVNTLAVPTTTVDVGKRLVFRVYLVFAAGSTDNLVTIEMRDSTISHVDTNILASSGGATKFSLFPATGSTGVTIGTTGAPFAKMYSSGGYAVNGTTITVDALGNLITVSPSGTTGTVGAGSATTPISTIYTSAGATVVPGTGPTGGIGLLTVPGVSGVSGALLRVGPIAGDSPASLISQLSITPGTTGLNVGSTGFPFNTVYTSQGSTVVPPAGPTGAVGLISVPGVSGANGGSILRVGPLGTGATATLVTQLSITPGAAGLSVGASGAPFSSAYFQDFVSVSGSTIRTDASGNFINVVNGVTGTFYHSAANMIPATGAFYDIGATGTPFRNLYLSSFVNLSGTRIGVDASGNLITVDAAGNTGAAGAGSSAAPVTNVYTTGGITTVPGTGPTGTVGLITVPGVSGVSGSILSVGPLGTGTAPTLVTQLSITAGTTGLNVGSTATPFNTVFTSSGVTTVPPAGPTGSVGLLTVPGVSGVSGAILSVGPLGTGTTPTMISQLSIAAGASGISLGTTTAPFTSTVTTAGSTVVPPAGPTGAVGLITVPGVSGTTNGQILSVGPLGTGATATLVTALSITPGAAGLSVGASGAPFSSAYLQNFLSISGSTIRTDASGNFINVVNGVTGTFYHSAAHVVPATGAFYDIGATGTRFRNLYVTAVDLSGTKLAIDASGNLVTIDLSGNTGSAGSGSVSAPVTNIYSTGGLTVPSTGTGPTGSVGLITVPGVSGVSGSILSVGPLGTGATATLVTQLSMSAGASGISLGTTTAPFATTVTTQGSTVVPPAGPTGSVGLITVPGVSGVSGSILSVGPLGTGASPTLVTQLSIAAGASGVSLGTTTAPFTTTVTTAGSTIVPPAGPTGSVGVLTIPGVSGTTNGQILSVGPLGTGATATLVTALSITAGSAGLSIGASGAPFSTAFLQNALNISGSTIQTDASGNFIQVVNGVTGTFYHSAAHVVPATGAFYDIGATGTRFRNLYVSGAVDLSGTKLAIDASGNLVTVSSSGVTGSAGSGSVSAPVTNIYSSGGLTVPQTGTGPTGSVGLITVPGISGVSGSILSVGPLGTGTTPTMITQLSITPGTTGLSVGSTGVPFSTVYTSSGVTTMPPAGPTGSVGLLTVPGVSGVSGAILSVGPLGTGTTPTMITQLSIAAGTTGISLGTTTAPFTSTVTTAGSTVVPPAGPTGAVGLITVPGVSGTTNGQILSVGPLGTGATATLVTALSITAGSAGLSIGASGAPFSTAFLQNALNISGSTIQTDASGNFIQVVNGVTGTFYHSAAHVVPATGAFYDIGATGTRFRNLYVSGAVDLSGTKLAIDASGNLVTVSPAGVTGSAGSGSAAAPVTNIFTTSGVTTVPPAGPTGSVGLITVPGVSGVSGSVLSIGPLGTGTAPTMITQLSITAGTTGLSVGSTTAPFTTTFTTAGTTVVPPAGPTGSVGLITVPGVSGTNNGQILSVGPLGTGATATLVTQLSITAGTTGLSVGSATVPFSSAFLQNSLNISGSTIQTDASGNFIQVVNGVTGTFYHSAAHVVPATGAFYDLGATGTRFRNLYVSGAVDLSGTKLAIDGSGNLVTVSPSGVTGSAGSGSVSAPVTNIFTSSGVTTVPGSGPTGSVGLITVPGVSGTNNGQILSVGPLGTGTTATLVTQLSVSAGTTGISLGTTTAPFTSTVTTQGSTVVPPAGPTGSVGLITVPGVSGVSGSILSVGPLGTGATATLVTQLSITPGKTGLNLGSASAPFGTAYVQNAINISGSSIAFNNAGQLVTVDALGNTGTIGGGTFSYSGPTGAILFADTASSVTGTTALTFTPGGTGIKISGHLLPTADNTYDLGATGTRWRSMYVGTNTLYVGTSAVSSDAQGNLIFQVPAGTTGVLTVDASGNTGTFGGGGAGSTGPTGASAGGGLIGVTGFAGGTGTTLPNNTSVGGVIFNQQGGQITLVDGSGNTILRAAGGAGKAGAMYLNTGITSAFSYTVPVGIEMIRVRAIGQSLPARDNNNIPLPRRTISGGWATLGALDASAEYSSGPGAYIDAIIPVSNLVGRTIQVGVPPEPRPGGAVYSNTSPMGAVRVYTNNDFNRPLFIAGSGGAGSATRIRNVIGYDAVNPQTISLNALPGTSNNFVNEDGTVTLSTTRADYRRLRVAKGGAAGAVSANGQAFRAEDGGDPEGRFITGVYTTDYTGVPAKRFFLTNTFNFGAGVQVRTSEFTNISMYMMRERQDVSATLSIASNGGGAIWWSTPVNPSISGNINVSIDVGTFRGVMNAGVYAVPLGANGGDVALTPSRFDQAAAVASAQVTISQSGVRSFSIPYNPVNVLNQGTGSRRLALYWWMNSTNSSGGTFFLNSNSHFTVSQYLAERAFYAQGSNVSGGLSMTSNYAPHTFTISAGQSKTYITDVVPVASYPVGAYTVEATISATPATPVTTGSNVSTILAPYTSGSEPMTNGFPGYLGSGKSGRVGSLAIGNPGNQASGIAVDLMAGIGTPYAEVPYFIYIVPPGGVNSTYNSTGGSFYLRTSITGTSLANPGRVYAFATMSHWNPSTQQFTRFGSFSGPRPWGVGEVGQLLTFDGATVPAPDPGSVWCIIGSISVEFGTITKASMLAESALYYGTWSTQTTITPARSLLMNVGPVDPTGTRISTFGGAASNVTISNISSSPTVIRAPIYQTTPLNVNTNTRLAVTFSNTGSGDMTISDFKLVTAVLQGVDRGMTAVLKTYGGKGAAPYIATTAATPITGVFPRITAYQDLAAPIGAYIRNVRSTFQQVSGDTIEFVPTGGFNGAGWHGITPDAGMIPGQYMYVAFPTALLPINMSTPYGNWTFSNVNSRNASEGGFYFGGSVSVNAYSGVDYKITPGYLNASGVWSAAAGFSEVRLKGNYAGLDGVSIEPYSANIPVPPAGSQFAFRITVLEPLGFPAFPANIRWYGSTTTSYPMSAFLQWNFSNISWSLIPTLTTLSGTGLPGSYPVNTNTALPYRVASGQTKTPQVTPTTVNVLGNSYTISSTIAFTQTLDGFGTQGWGGRGIVDGGDGAWFSESSTASLSGVPTGMYAGGGGGLSYFDASRCILLESRGAGSSNVSAGTFGGWGWDGSGAAVEISPLYDLITSSTNALMEAAALRSYNPAGSLLMQPDRLTFSTPVQGGYTPANSFLTFSPGTVTAGGSFLNASDRRMKDQIAPLSNAHQIIRGLKPVSYKWKMGDDATHLGFIAQDVEEVAPELVGSTTTHDLSDGKAVDYQGIIGPLVKVVQDLQDEIETLKRKDPKA